MIMIMLCTSQISNFPQLIYSYTYKYIYLYWYILTLSMVCSPNQHFFLKLYIHDYCLFFWLMRYTDIDTDTDTMNWLWNMLSSFLCAAAYLCFSYYRCQVCLFIFKDSNWRNKQFSFYVPCCLGCQKLSTMIQNRLWYKLTAICFVPTYTSTFVTFHIPCCYRDAVSWQCRHF